MRTDIARKIAGRRLAAADKAEADKSWDHFHAQVHLLAKDVTQDIASMLRIVDQAYTMRKQVGTGAEEAKIKKAHSAVEDALDIIDSRRELSGLATALGRMHSPLIRADQEAYGVKV